MYPSLGEITNLSGGAYYPTHTQTSAPRFGCIMHPDLDQCFREAYIRGSVGLKSGGGIFSTAYRARPAQSVCQLIDPSGGADGLVRAT
jgi:hypothetical protein